MAGPHETDHSGQTQQPEWGGTGGHQMGEQPPVEDGGGGYTGGGYGQYGPPGTYGAYGAYGGGGGGQPSGWGYAEQPSGSGAGWGYVPGYVPPSATPGSTSRPLPGSPEQAPQDAQGWAGGYAGGYYGPPSQSLQPFQPPQPPYGSYGPVSQYGGYGQYGPPSQYGGYGGYGQYGPPSAWGPPVVIEEQVRQPWSMRRKLAVFGGLVALLVVLAGGGLGYTQYNAPTSAANRICSDFQSQRYVDMYGLFDTQLQARMTSVEFAQAVLDLDRAEGQTAKCDVAVHANGFTDSSTTATIVLTRPNANGLQGAARLKNEGGSWKVTALDQSLFGVDLRALNSLDSYCTALISQTYDAAYGMLDKGMQGTQKVADFRREAGWRDEIDGNATNCHAAAIGANNDSTASMTLSVTRSRAGEHTGTIMLVVEGAAWKVHTVADEALGTDIGPIRTATRFCNDLARGNYGDLANLILGLIPAGADIASLFNGDTNGIKWTGCTLDLSTYKVSGAGSSLNAGFSLEEISSGRTGNISIELIFTKVGHDWKLSNMKIVNP
ncbi:MAG TPA: hypothetical protein VF510_08835 [Ktedonobacterales bacterium]